MIKRVFRKCKPKATPQNMELMHGDDWPQEKTICRVYKAFHSACHYRRTNGSTGLYAAFSVGRFDFTLSGTKNFPRTGHVVYCPSQLVFGVVKSWRPFFFLLLTLLEAYFVSLMKRGPIFQAELSLSGRNSKSCWRGSDEPPEPPLDTGLGSRHKWQKLSRATLQASNKNYHTTV